ncbi:oligopeptide/dipeptide ABC transporter ATP-binding protein [Allorhizobium undicola]|uniref:oligopeptide/dipeptide ABC transporter ATP-binding protein n=1 Tax=Allorhizobium undicola TaxID=78527 RepID=UPI00055AEF74|nr:oligopeptide/dipeptide ABC transporter ATP-binding protein [Allorhizobium undicola]
MTQPPLLELRHLSRTYRRSALPVAALRQGMHSSKALDDVSLTMASGTIHAIVGESGSGKSTLARLVMALDRPDNGEVLIDGQNLFTLGEKTLRRKRRDFQMVFQDPFSSLDPRQNVATIIGEPLCLLEPRLSTAEKQERIAAIMQAVGLTAEQAGLRPHAFSGGQRQRIALARALITEPRLVVADEPVSALDLSVQAQVLNLMTDFKEKRGVSFLFISHNLAVVNHVADHVSVLYRGRLVESGPAQSILSQPLHPYTALLAACEPDPFRERQGSVPLNGPDDDSLAARGCAFQPRCAFAVEACTKESPELADIAPLRKCACHRSAEFRTE